MRNRLDSISETLLMGPGPSAVPSEVYAALSRPTLGHMDPSFIAIMDEIKGLLRIVMGTRNPLTIPVSGTGSAGMEAAFVNLVEPGDRVLVAVNGAFGQRMVDVASRLGAEVETLAFDWGTPVDPDAVADRLRTATFNMVGVVHAETSTGVRNPVAEIGALVRESGALYLVDAVTSLGGMPVEVDAWGIDALYSGTQKCLSCPPGLAPLTFSERAVKRLAARTRKVPNWYLDLGLLVDYWQGGTRAYHHTAPVNMLYGLYQALQLGTVDAAEYNDWLVNKEMGLHEVTKFVIEPVLHIGTCDDKDLLVNPKAWAELPDDLKNIVMMGRDYARYLSANAYGIESKRVKQEWLKRGVQIITLPEKDVKEIRGIAAKVILDFAKKTPQTAEYVATYAKVLNDLGYAEEAKALGFK